MDFDLRGVARRESRVNGSSDAKKLATGRAIEAHGVFALAREMVDHDGFPKSLGEPSSRVVGFVERHALPFFLPFG